MPCSSQGTRNVTREQSDQEMSLSPLCSGVPVVSKKESNRAKEESCTSNYQETGRINNGGMVDGVPILNNRGLAADPTEVMRKQSWLLSLFINAREVVNKERLEELSMSQLKALGEELQLEVSKKHSKKDLLGQIIFRLEEFGKQSSMKAHDTSPLVQPLDGHKIHIVPNSRSKAVCLFWSNGNCKRGDACQ